MFYKIDLLSNEGSMTTHVAHEQLDVPLPI